MAEKRLSVIWRKKGETILGFYIRPDEKSITSNTPEKVLEYVIAENGWGCVDDREKEIFVRDAKAGLVTIGIGVNTKFDDYEKWKDGDLFAREMHSVNNFKAFMYVMHPHQTTGYGWAYRVVKERPLNVSEREIINKCDELIQHNKKIDNIYYLLHMLLQFNPTIINKTSGTRGKFGRYTNDIKYYTTECKTYQEAKEYTDRIYKVISDTYQAIYEATGYKLVERTKGAELPEVFIASRTSSNLDFELKGDEKQKPLSEYYSALLSMGAIKKSNMVHDGFGVLQIPTDDSVLVQKNDVSYGPSRVHFHAYGIAGPECFKDTPDCFTISNPHNERDIDCLVVWGDTKTLVETVGIESFLTLVANKYQTNNN